MVIISSLVHEEAVVEMAGGEKVVRMVVMVCQGEMPMIGILEV